MTTHDSAPDPHDDPTVELPPLETPSETPSATQRGRGPLASAIAQATAQVGALRDRIRRRLLSLPVALILGSVLASVGLASIAVQTRRAAQATVTAEAIPPAIIGGLLAVALLGVAALVSVAVAIIRLGAAARERRRAISRLVDDLGQDLLGPTG